jgi:hypothetical protein
MQNLLYEVLVLIAQRIYQGRDILDWLKASEKCSRFGDLLLVLKLEGVFHDRIY